MISAAISRIAILVFGTLYPAYCSYKAIRTKNVKEYVRWMMHWVVFACFVACETISDVFLSWFPFYYEIKLCIVLWLLSPLTKGSSILYKKFIHPKLSRHEQDIDEYINQAKERGYKAVMDVGTKTFDYASKLIVETAIKATTSVVSLPKETNRDVTDFAAREVPTVEDVRSSQTPERAREIRNIVRLTPENIILVPERKESFQDTNFEFSDGDLDVEMEVDPPRTRTRSQSRVKENSVAPVEAEPKRNKVKRVVKKKTVIKNEIKPRRPIYIEEEDDYEYTEPF